MTAKPERIRGKFAKGHKRLGGRKKGKRNHYTRDIRTALLAAGEHLGGEGGLTQFFIDVGTKDPKALGTWIAALLPRQNKLDEDVVETPGMVINIVGVPSGTMFSRAEIAAMELDEMQPLIEHEHTPPLLIDGDDEPPAN